jgi:hypothetical protein
MPRLLPLVLGAALLALPAVAQQSYSITWPDSPLEEPVWELDVLPPALSSGPNGSGVEIRDVYYNGHLVMKRGHVPILNVKYTAGCNCFRDWQDQEVRFIADNPIASPSWIAEAAPGTVATMCDVAPANCADTNGDGAVDECEDVGDFDGVAVERFADVLRLTTHLSAGWYRYTMRWEFHRDGTIRPLFGFTSTGTACTQNDRRHHTYWRFDFDIDGAEGDYVVETSDVADDVVFDAETTRLWGDSADGVAWSVFDAETGRGYRLAPSEVDYETPADPQTGNPAIDEFAEEDAVIARYDPSEIDDGASGCTAKFTAEETSDPIVDGESLADADVVLWYRSGITKPDIDPGRCYESGPVLTPLGDWSALPPVAAEEDATPQGFTLEEAYPNPFDRTTTVRFSVDEPQRVALTLYDALGREVRTLFEGRLTAGAEEAVVIDGSALPSGAYTVRLEGASATASTRIVLLK